MCANAFETISKHARVYLNEAERIALTFLSYSCYPQRTGRMDVVCTQNGPSFRTDSFINCTAAMAAKQTRQVIQQTISSLTNTCTHAYSAPNLFSVLTMQTHTNGQVNIQINIQLTHKLMIV